MDQKSQTVKNAIFSIIQVLVMGICLFFLYRFILDTIGVEKLGVWSLLIATTSVSKVANVGLSGGVVKFVAKYLALKDEYKVSKLIQTALITVGSLVAIFMIIFYFLAETILALFIDISMLGEALAIVPIVICTVWLMSVSMIVLGSLDGNQRVDLRNIILIAGIIFYVVLSVVLIGKYGLLGLALAHLFQYLGILVSGIIILRRLIWIPFIPRTWDKELFIEMIGYGISFQAMSVVQLIYDPLTKALISYFGGLVMVGYYEMANKMVQQVRALIVTANRVLVPTIANFNETASNRIERVYLQSLKLCFYVSVPAYCFLALFTPIISNYWIGHLEPLFVIMSFILIPGWAFNTIAAPSYFVYLGIGRLKWNLISHIIIAVLNASLAYMMGLIYGGLGVVYGWVIGLIIGSSVTLIAYHIELKCNWKIIFTSSDIYLLISNLSAVFIGLKLLYSVYLFYAPLSAQLLTLIFLYACIVVLPMLKHPIRYVLQELIFHTVLRKETSEAK